MKWDRLFSIAFLCNSSDRANALTSTQSSSASICLKNSVITDDIPLQVAGSHSVPLRSSRDQKDAIRYVRRDGEDGNNTGRHREQAPRNRERKVKRASKEKDRSTNNARAPSKSTTGVDLPYELTMQALRAYEAKHSNLVLPRRFVVPATQGKFSLSQDCDAV